MSKSPESKPSASPDVLNNSLSIKSANISGGRFGLRTGSRTDVVAGNVRIEDCESAAMYFSGGGNIELGHVEIRGCGNGILTFPEPSEDLIDEMEHFYLTEKNFSAARSEIIEEIRSFRINKNRSHRISAYERIVSIVADHATLMSPFLPMLMVLANKNI